MTPIAAGSSVPPHIQPPIAQVPSAMRESLKGVARYSISAVSRLASEVMIFLVRCLPRSFFDRRRRTPIYRSENACHDLCLNDLEYRPCADIGWFNALGGDHAIALE